MTTIALKKFARTIADPSGVQTIIDAYQAAHDETADTPGEATSTVRAYASLLMDQFEDASLYVQEEVAPYQVIL